MWIKGKSAEEKLLTPWLFLNWILIGGAITAGVLIFYNLSIDVRESESEILTWKIIDCFSNNGYFDENILENDFDFYTSCGLNKKVLDESGLYYLNILIYEDTGSTGIKKKEFEIGTKDLEMQCRLGSIVSENNKKYPQCDENIVKMGNGAGKLFVLNIVTVSDQKGARL